MLDIFDIYVESYKNFDKKINSSEELDSAKILKNFKETEEFKRLSEGLNKEKKDILSSAAEEAVEKMVKDIESILGPFNKANLKFVQFTSPEKKGGYSAGYLIPNSIISQDSIEVKSIATAKKNEKRIKLGEYLTEEAYKKIKDAANG